MVLRRPWATHRNRHDRMLAPLADLVLTAAAIQSGDTMLDVGCGYGATTLAAAGAARPGRVVGVDLSAPMLARHAGVPLPRASPTWTSSRGTCAVHHVESVR
jgi:SAM-dependent methyltransferase